MIKLHEILLMKISTLCKVFTSTGGNENKREAVIRDFYKEGEDKIVFWKKLTDY